MLQFPPTEFYVGNQQGGQEACEKKYKQTIIGYAGPVVRIKQRHLVRK